MEPTHFRFCSFISFFFLFLIAFYFVIPFSQAKSPSLGVHPLGEKYFASRFIKCKDGSKSFTRDRLNDNFCDCVDGTDEPGTSACPGGKFYFQNLIAVMEVMSMIAASIAPNTCVMGGNLEYKAGRYISYTGAKESNDRTR